MNIVMMTNTYTPHTGGVARSVEWFSEELRRLGHRVLVVAPSFDDMPADERDVVRVPAIQNFNGSDFSVRLPIPGLLRTAIDEFQPELVHTHHPFLLGETALRIAALRNLPTVFTHHTMYEQYTHYVPGDSPAMQRFAVRLATEFANLCDHVVAPSESIANVLQQRGVTSDITAIPTGIDTAHFARGTGSAARRKYDIPGDAFVVGHVGRLAPEKNLAFLARSVCRFLQSHPKAHFLLVGDGPSLDEIRKVCNSQNVEKQLHHPDGLLDGQDLVDAYHAMDVFAFASHSETQGMVLAEAMAAGVPVVAVDAPGGREVVCDTINGRLLPDDDEDEFAAALSWHAERSAQQQDQLIQAARRTAEQFAMSTCAAQLVGVYEKATAVGAQRLPRDDSDWAAALRLLGEQWSILTGVATAVGDALFGSESDERAVQ
jgi:glycosyltransferase involved in cell wall biosynthesis